MKDNFIKQKPKFREHQVLFAAVIIVVFTVSVLTAGKNGQSGIIEEIIKGNVHPKPYETQIFLISSEDHGNTWQYNGVLIGQNDARNLNTPFLTASSLFEENGREFLLVSPVTPKGHNGILVFEFENIAEAKLKRDSSSKLILVKRVEPFIEGEFSGCGDYDSKKTYGGIIISQVDILKVIEKKSIEGGMQIFDTKEKLLMD